MSSLSDAFNSLLGIHKRVMKLERPEVHPAITINVTPSNYNRNAAGPEETTIAGREYVISRQQLSAEYTPPLIGDTLTEGELTYQTITEVIEMYDFGGGIMGYRCRTS